MISKTYCIVIASNIVTPQTIHNIFGQSAIFASTKKNILNSKQPRKGRTQKGPQLKEQKKTIQRIHLYRMYVFYLIIFWEWQPKIKIGSQEIDEQKENKDLRKRKMLGNDGTKEQASS